MTEPTDISFETGYKRLEEIAERVNSETVSVDEMCDLFAEGRGLDKALTAYLEEQKGRIERIERGEDVPEFRITRTADVSAEANGEVVAAPDEELPF